MLRRGCRVLFVLSLIIIGTISASASGSQQDRSQIFGIRGLGDTYSGVEARMSAQDPYFPHPDVDSRYFWAAGPVGLSMWPSGAFIEGGNLKDFDSTDNRWELHPYRSANNGTNSHFSWYPSMTLQPATYYRYQVFLKTTPKQYRVQVFTTASAPILLDFDMKRDYFSHVVVGGEGLCALPIPGGAPSNAGRPCPTGYTAARDNRFQQWKDRLWYSYCYTESKNNVAYDGAVLSSCGPGPNFWVLYK